MCACESVCGSLRVSLFLSVYVCLCVCVYVCVCVFSVVVFVTFHVGGSDEKQAICSVLQIDML